MTLHPDEKPHPLPVEKNKILSGFWSPGGLFLGGFLLLVTGFCLNFFFSQQGELRLEAGKPRQLQAGTQNTADPEQPTDLSGLVLTLDSLKIQPYTPEFEILLTKRDSAAANPHVSAGASTMAQISRFSMEPMKIRKIEGTDFSFRLKDFFPNFQFAYDYPANRDTITPKAPGITIELKTREGTPVVTLRSGQPGPSKLRDVVSLGAELHFYWELPPDSIKAIVENPSITLNRIVFSGADKRLFFILNGNIEEKPLKENFFYTMPGQDSVGFTILYCFPDAAYLKAVPSSQGTELLNPVAHVEIWKSGGSAQDAFVYPETSTKKGGDFQIPRTGYKIGLGEVKEKAIKYCDCSVSIQKDSSRAPESLSFASGKSRRYGGYRFTPLECSAGLPKTMTLQVSRQPGSILLMAGALMGGLALLLFIARKNA